MNIKKAGSKPCFLNLIPGRELEGSTLVVAEGVGNHEDGSSFPISNFSTVGVVGISGVVLVEPSGTGEA